MSKINKAKIRRDIAQELVTYFESTGAEYTCAASIYSVVGDLATKRAQELLSKGINLSNSSYSFNLIPSMASMFSTDAMKIIHEKKYPRK